MKSMSWGWRIAILYCGFVVMIVCLVGMSVAQKIDLVTEDYYEQELVFQNKLDKINRANALTTPLKWKVGEEDLEIFFPEEVWSKGIAGSVNFYCPSDNQKDTMVTINRIDEDGRMLIPKSVLQSGRYKMQIDWSADDLTYWNETVIQL